MEETLQHEETAQCIGLTPAGPGHHRPNGSKADHALTFKLDHLMRADHRVCGPPRLPCEPSGKRVTSNQLRRDNYRTECWDARSTEPEES